MHDNWSLLNSLFLLPSKYVKRRKMWSNVCRSKIFLSASKFMNLTTCPSITVGILFLFFSGNINAPSIVCRFKIYECKRKCSLFRMCAKSFLFSNFPYLLIRKMHCKRTLRGIWDTNVIFFASFCNVKSNNKNKFLELPSSLFLQV